MLIEWGKIKKRKGSTKDESGKEKICYKMRFLEIGDLSEILSLQDLVAENLPIAEIFRLHEEDYFRDLFRLENSLIGVLTEKGLIAYSIIRIPGQDEENLGRYIELPHRELDKVVHLQAAAVHPLFRGNGLQRKMAEAHLKVIGDFGLTHACCTVSPKNPASLENIFSMGFVIKSLRPMFQNWWRYIMYKNISYSTHFEKENESEKVSILNLDFKGQEDLLRRGFVGIKMVRLAEVFRIIYAKPLNPID